MNFRSLADLNKAIVQGLPKIPRDVDLIVGIPRSGLLAANILALHLNLPLTDVEGLIEGRLIHSGRRLNVPDREKGLQFARKVLVIDDSVASGASMRATRQRLEEAKLECDVIYVAVYGLPSKRSEVDICFEEVLLRRMFEWNFMHCKELANCCVDIDGVLCVDPTEEENDDAERYRDFLIQTNPLLIPSMPVGWLVTSRLEKYRSQTEDWLHRHGVVFRELRMLDLPNKEARIAAKCHASFKAGIYKETDAFLFIESDLGQSHDIARLTGRPVLCVKTRQMVYPSTGAHVPVRLAKIVHFVKRGIQRVMHLLRRHVFRFDPPPSF